MIAELEEEGVTEHTVILQLTHEDHAQQSILSKPQFEVGESSKLVVGPTVLEIEEGEIVVPNDPLAFVLMEGQVAPEVNSLGPKDHERHVHWGDDSQQQVVTKRLWALI